MRLDKCNAYTAKETLGYRERKSYMSAARVAAKREEKQRETEEETSLKINYRNPPIRRRDEPIKIRTKKRKVTPINKKQKKQQTERR